MEKLLEEYRYGYQLLRMAIEGLSEEELRFKPEADKWSIHQILIHLADSELVSFTLKQLLEYRVEHVRGHLAQIARVREAYWLR